MAIMSLRVDEESTHSSRALEVAVNDFVQQFDSDRSSTSSGKNPLHCSDDRSITTQSVQLHMAIDSAPSLVQDMLHSSAWYDAFVTTEKKSELKCEDVSCVASILDSQTATTDPLAEFTDHQLFQLQQYRIAELTSQLDLVRNSVAEYHDLLDRFHTMQQDNRVLSHKVSLLEQQVRKKSTTSNKQKAKLERNKELVKVQADETRRLREEVAELKLALAESQSREDDEGDEKIRILEETVVKLKMDLADSKSKEDWHRLKRPSFGR